MPPQAFVDRDVSTKTAVAIPEKLGKDPTGVSRQVPAMLPSLITVIALTQLLIAAGCGVMAWRARHRCHQLHPASRGHARARFFSRAWTTLALVGLFAASPVLLVNSGHRALGGERSTAVLGDLR